MFCNQCGAKNEEHSRFCLQCGAQLPLPTPEEPEIPVVPVEAESPADVSEVVFEKPTRRVRRKRSKKGLWIGLGVAGGAGILVTAATAIVSCVLVAIMVIILAFNFSTPKSVVNKYIKAGLKPNMSAVLKYLPEKAIEDELQDMDEEEWAEICNENVKSYYDYFDTEYDEWDISYSITAVDDVSTSYLESVKEHYKEEYNYKVKDAKIVTVTCVYELDGYAYTQDFQYLTVKIGFKWYVDMYASASPFRILQYAIRF